VSPCRVECCRLMATQAKVYTGRTWAIKPCGSEKPIAAIVFSGIYWILVIME